MNQNIVFKEQGKGETGKLNHKKRFVSCTDSRKRWEKWEKCVL